MITVEPATAVENATANQTPTPTAAVPMINPAAAFMTSTFGLATTSAKPATSAPAGVILLSRLRNVGEWVARCRVTHRPTARRINTTPIPIRTHGAHDGDPWSSP